MIEKLKTTIKMIPVFVGISACSFIGYSMVKHDFKKREQQIHDQYQVQINGFDYKKIKEHFDCSGDCNQQIKDTIINYHFLKSLQEETEQ